jgi:hypothetical protein
MMATQGFNEYVESILFKTLLLLLLLLLRLRLLIISDHLAYPCKVAFECNDR